MTYDNWWVSILSAALKAAECCIDEKCFCCGGKEAKELDTTSSTPVCQKPGCRNWLQMFAGYHSAPYAAAWGQIANVLFPAGFTCGGTKPAIDKLCEIATKACHSVCVAGSPEGTAKLCLCGLALVFQRICVPIILFFRWFLDKFLWLVPPINDLSG